MSPSGALPFGTGRETRGLVGSGARRLKSALGAPRTSRVASRRPSISFGALIAMALALWCAAGPAWAAAERSAVVRPGRATIHVTLPLPYVTLGPSNGQTPPGRFASGLSPLDETIATAPAGAVIHLSSGRYGEIIDQTARNSWVTVSGAGDHPAPTIAGAELWGAQRIRFIDVRFSGNVGIDHNPTLHYAQRAKDVEIIDSTIDCGSTRSTPASVGLSIRGGSLDVTIAGDYVHNCVDGLVSQAQDLLSRNIRIVHCTFAHFQGDAFVLGGLANVAVDDDVIADIADPANVIHNDGILILGNDHEISITNDIFANSRVQLIFIQPAVAGTVTRVRSNTDILVAHDLLYGAGGVAVQDQGGIDVDFVANTFWNNYYGSLWVLNSGDQPAEGTIVVDNIIDGFLVYKSTLADENHNLIVAVAGPGPHRFGRDDLLGVDPDFVDAQAGDFQLTLDSPAREAGSRYPTRVTIAIESKDMFGLPDPTRVSIGAFGAQDPAIAYGRPEFVDGPVVR